MRRRYPSSSATTPGTNEGAGGASARRRNARTSARRLFMGLQPLQCPETESNRRHGDFQSPALPTELSGQRARRLPSAANDVNLLRQLGDDFFAQTRLARYVLALTGSKALSTPPGGAGATNENTSFSPNRSASTSTCPPFSSAAEEQLVAERPLHLVLDQPVERARAEVGVVALLGEVRRCAASVSSMRHVRARRAAPRARS